MKQGSTLFLRGVVFIIGLTVLGLCMLVLPRGIGDEHVGGYRPLLLAMYVTAIPFFIALHHSLKLLHYIDTNQAFSPLSIRALQYVKYCALSVGLLFGLALPYVYIVADSDDAPGVIILALVIAFASVVFAAFAAVLQKLVQSAVDIKSENDLTV